jgi:hypothetical protein
MECTRDAVEQQKAWPRLFLVGTRWMLDQMDAE